MLSVFNPSVLAGSGFKAPALAAPAPATTLSPAGNFFPAGLAALADLLAFGDLINKS